MRVFEAPPQTRDAVLSKYRMALARNDPEEIEEFDLLVSGDSKISDTDIFDELLPSVDALLGITDLMLNSTTVSETQYEWLCNQFVPLESFGEYDSDIISDLIYPEDLPRAIRTLDWFMEARKDQQVQKQFGLMFPDEISKGASIKNPLDWSCYQMEDVMDAFTPENLASARNERWDPQERGFTTEEAEVAYDQNGILIVRTLKPRAATAYASGTRWCTSDASTAQGYLSTGPLYVVFENGKKYAQAHYGFKERVLSEYVSFMDTRDRSIYDARDEIRRAVVDTILKDAYDHYGGEGMMTIDEHIANEYAKAVAKRDLEVSRANSALVSLERNQFLGSPIFSDRITNSEFATKQAKRIVDAEDALADAMIKIGASASREVFRININAPIRRTQIQRYLNEDECLGGASIDIGMDSEQVSDYIDLILENYVQWRNDNTIDRPEAVQVILETPVSDDDRVTQLLIRIGDWCRADSWDEVGWQDDNLAEAIKRYYNDLPSPIPQELVVALHNSASKPEDNRWILRRAKAETKRRIGRYSDEATDTEEFFVTPRLEELFETVRDIQSEKFDIFSVCNALREDHADNMLLASKAFDRLRSMIPDGTLYSLPYQLDGNNRAEQDEMQERWIKAALNARKNLPIETMQSFEVRADGPDQDGDYRGYAEITIRDWKGDLHVEDEVELLDWRYYRSAKKAINSFLRRNGELREEVEINALVSTQKWCHNDLDEYGQRLVDIERLVELGHKDHFTEDLGYIDNYWIGIFVINTAFQLRFGYDEWETFVTGGTPGYGNDLLSRIARVKLNDGLTIGQYIGNNAPIERKDVMSRYLHTGLLLTDDKVISGQTYRDLRGRQLSPAPSIAGSYLNYEINLASPDDHMDLTREVLSIYESGGTPVDDPVMDFFKGYFVEPHIPMSQRVVRQVENSGKPKPPAILGYVCFNTRRWIEWDADYGWTEMWRPGTRHRKRAQPDHVLAVMPDVTSRYQGYGYANNYDSTLTPISAKILWCTVCGGARGNPRGGNSFATRFATGSVNSWQESSSKCYCRGSNRYEILYDELAE